MRLARVSLAVAALAATALSTSGPASAEEPGPGTATITDVRPTILVKADGTGSALFHYTCSGGFGHLYVAVKQGPTISTTNTSSQYATSYSSTNSLVDEGPNLLTCDGVEHVAKVSLARDPSFSPDAPALSPGTALLQICITDMTGLSMNYSMKPVVRIGARG